MTSKETVFGVCNWLMACIAIAVCGYAFTSMFSSPPRSEWIVSAQQDQGRYVPSSAVTSSPATKAAAKAAPASMPNANAGRPLDNSAGRPAFPQESVWGDAPVSTAPATPIPALNPYTLPPGMENEANPNPPPPRPKK